MPKVHGSQTRTMFKGTSGTADFRILKLARDCFKHVLKYTEDKGKCPKSQLFLRKLN